MSIAVNTQRAQAHAPARRLARQAPAERTMLSQEEQLREMRGLMRHFVLAFMAAGAGLYAAVAAGLTF